MKSGRGKQACCWNFICGGLPCCVLCHCFGDHSQNQCSLIHTPFLKYPQCYRKALSIEKLWSAAFHTNVSLSVGFVDRKIKGAGISSHFIDTVCVCLPDRNWGLLPFMVTLHQMCHRHSDLPDTSRLSLLGLLLRTNTVINTQKVAWQT